MTTKPVDWLDEDLEDLRLQLLIADNLAGAHLELTPEDIWNTLALDGRVNPAQWNPARHSVTPIYPQILTYFGILDAVSGALYGDRIATRQRFLRLLRNFLKWPYAGRVSIPHLYQLLRANPLPELEDARERVYKILDEAGDDFTVEMDESTGKVGAWFKGDVKGKLSPTGLTLDQLSHEHLLYRYRSRVVHAMRGYGFLPARLASDPSTRPEYHLIDWSGDLLYQLTYPVGLIAGLTHRALDMLPSYVRHWRLTGLKRRKFDVYFYDELNVEL